MSITNNIIKNKSKYIAKSHSSHFQKIYEINVLRIVMVEMP
jgi:hypothetical protein